MRGGYHLADFGAYTVGGRTVEVTGKPTRQISFTPTATATYDPNGTFVIEHLYVQYFTPAARNAAPPVILLHGGGLTGATWETTPDGRPGWLHGLLDRGYEVHVVDGVERGRAGWCALEGVWPDQAVQRSLEEAWTLFRFGAEPDFAARKPFAGQRFPVAALEAFARTFVPRWTSTGPAATRACTALIERFDAAIIICHSQGAQFAFEAASRHPERIAAICAVEPSGFTSRPEALIGVPVLFVGGDYLDCDVIWRQMSSRWSDWAGALSSSAPGAVAVSNLSLPAEGISGNSHMIMMDDNAEEVLARIHDWLEGVTPR